MFLKLKVLLMRKLLFTHHIESFPGRVEGVSELPEEFCIDEDEGEDRSVEEEESEENGAIPEKCVGCSNTVASQFTKNRSLIHHHD